MSKGNAIAGISGGRTSARMACGELDDKDKVSVRTTDAADVVHWFHPKCWREFVAWMKCESCGREDS